MIQAGFSLGGIARISLAKGFYLEPGLFFYYTGMSSKDLVTFDNEYYYEDAAKYYGLRIPLLAGYKFSISPQLDMSVATGPYLNVNLYARQQLSPNLEATHFARQENQPLQSRMEACRCRMGHTTEHDVCP